jgi:hypothetical protein
MAIVDRKLLGEGSVCSVLLKKLHPADPVAHFIPNAIATQHLNDLVAVCQGPARRAGGRPMKSAIFFTSPLLGDEEFWCSKHFVKVPTSCPDENVFAPPSPAAPCANPVVNLKENVTRTNDLDKDIAHFRALGIQPPPQPPLTAPEITKQVSMMVRLAAEMGTVNAGSSHHQM